ncbi:MAG: YbhB/YbcL family Raf kinase inhibitor-like protein [Halofilum sp. (in: g-proteobacteria)]
MRLSSPAFEHDGAIPRKYACEGSNISPPLRISGVPEEAVSLALIMDDPDVPLALREDGMWDHWIVYDIPPDLRELGEGEEPNGTHGLGTAENLDYFGPCPPDTEHRYYFKIYALDTRLNLPERASKQQVEQAMQGNVLDQAELMGRYECAEENKKM